MNYRLMKRGSGQPDDTDKCGVQEAVRLRASERFSACASKQTRGVYEYKLASYRIFTVSDRSMDSIGCFLPQAVHVNRGTTSDMRT